MLSEILVGVVLLVLLLQYLTQKRPPNFPPGPTGVPVLGYIPFIGKQRVPDKLAELSKKYGNVMSVYLGNTPVVVISDNKLVREAFKDDRFSGRPDLYVQRARTFGKLRGLFTGNGRNWVEQRRFIMKTLRDFGFGKGSIENMMHDEISHFVSELKNHVGKPTQLDHLFDATVLNTLWCLLTGERFDYGDVKLDEISRNLSKLFATTSAAGPLFFFEWFVKLFPELSGFNQFTKVMDSTCTFLSDHVKKARSTVDYDHPRGVIDVYLKEIKETSDKGSSFYREEGDINLLVVLMDIFAAGQDTTSITLRWAILYLILHTHAQQKAHEQIVSVVGTSRLPSLTDRQNLPYVEAILAETFRLASLTPLTVPHATTETVKFQGYTIPKGTTVLGNLCQLHHDKDYWGDPENFRPERFLTPDGKFKNDEALLPFSIGKRVCIGETMARDSVFLFLSGMLQQIQFEVDKTKPLPTTEQQDGIIVKPSVFEVVMTERT